MFSADPKLSIPSASLKKWRWKHFVKLAVEMRTSHGKCHYGALLDYYTSSLESSNVEPHRIAAFIMAVLKRVLPSSISSSAAFMNHLKASNTILFPFQTECLAF